MLYDTQVAIKVRLVRVTGLLDRVHVLHPEYQLLFFLGLARWAHRFKQKGFIHLARNKYLSLSQLMSNHKTDDVLEMIADMRTTGSALWFLNEATDDQEAQACPFAFTAKAHPSIAPTAAARGQYGRRFSIRRQ